MSVTWSKSSCVFSKSVPLLDLPPCLEEVLSWNLSLLMIFTPWPRMISQGKHHRTQQPSPMPSESLLKLPERGDQLYNQEAIWLTLSGPSQGQLSKRCLLATSCIQVLRRARREAAPGHVRFPVAACRGVPYLLPLALTFASSSKRKYMIDLESNNNVACRAFPYSPCDGRLTSAPASDFFVFQPGKCFLSELANLPMEPFSRNSIHHLLATSV